MVMEDKLLHLEKVLYPICVTESGIVMEDKFLQPAKAPFPICVTEFGIKKCEVFLLKNEIRVFLPLVYKACSSASKAEL